MNIKDKRPVLFEKSINNIWTDPYIQQQMLQAHLDRNSDGASRRMDSISRTVDFIKSLVPPGAHILDLGCGPGLYAGMLRDAGYRITGVDFNQASIKYAGGCREDIKYMEADYIGAYPPGRFDAVMMIYCDMGTHSDAERDVLLGRIHHSLADGGKLIFDLFTDKLAAERTESKNWEYAPSGGFWSEKGYLLLNQIFHYPANRCFAYQYNLLTDSGTKHFILWDRYYTEDEVKDLLMRKGFKNIRINKSMLGKNNFTSGSEMFIVAVK